VFVRVIVCGAEQVGSTIARHLATEGIDVTVIDSSPEQVHWRRELVAPGNCLGSNTRRSIA
jgi:Trk K+ transport system NAD-binding subunit